MLDRMPFDADSLLCQPYERMEVYYVANRLTEDQADQPDGGETPSTFAKLPC